MKPYSTVLFGFMSLSIGGFYQYRYALLIIITAREDHMIYYNTTQTMPQRPLAASNPWIACVM
jgi:hypothetical protein